MTDDVQPQAQYKDDDLVYVDPDTRTVVGKVEWTKADKPKSMVFVKDETKVELRKDGTPRRGFHRKYFPWGTYKSMKRIYKLDGKTKEAEPNKTLEEILPKALESAFWNN